MPCTDGSRCRDINTSIAARGFRSSHCLIKPCKRSGPNEMHCQSRVGLGTVCVVASISFEKVNGKLPGLSHLASLLSSLLSTEYQQSIH